MTMSLNMTHAMNQEKVRRFGKLFGTIDFEMNQELSSDLINKQYKDTVVGTFQIGGKEFPVTLAELERISETADNAKTTFLKSYSMGKYYR